MEEEGYFTGDKRILFEYWQDSTRVRKFLSGGTRTPMVNYVIKNDLKYLQGVSWLDIGGGPGFIQDRVGTDIVRIAVVLDISFNALRIHNVPLSQRIVGSFEFPPFRNGAFDVISSFFCFSDYPDLVYILTSLLRFTTKYIIYVDYSVGDQYWEERKKLHGRGLVGNLNLRDNKQISEALVSSGLEVLTSETCEFSTDSKQFKNQFPDMSETIIRKFLHIVLCKP